LSLTARHVPLAIRTRQRQRRHAMHVAPLRVARNRPMIVAHIIVRAEPGRAAEPKWVSSIRRALAFCHYGNVI
jgi:hypothetical protein